MRGFFTAALFILLNLDAAQAACSARRGPGYRAGGRCIGWADLVRSCGCKATTS